MAFLIVEKTSNSIDFTKALNTFVEIGLKDSTEFDFGSKKVWIFKKQLVKEDQYISENNTFLLSSGTPIYKKSKNLTESLKLILNDLKKGVFNYENVRGNFTLLFSKDGIDLELLVDHSGISNVYFDKSESIISSSFLAVVNGIKAKLNLNILSITEVLTTGRLIGPDTLINEIYRFEFNECTKISNINIVIDSDLLTFPEQNKISFNESVNNQISYINSFFEDVKNFANSYGVDSGLTGGHDSRMILIFMKKYFSNFQIHSFWRKNKDKDIVIAEEIAHVVKKELFVYPVKHHMNFSEEEMEENLKNSFLFYDGHIRMHCFLTEAYNTAQHRIELLKDKRICMNGVGGEQYRNEFHIQSSKLKLEYFVKHYLGYNISGKCHTNAKSEKLYFDHLIKKISKKINIKNENIDRKNVQKYYNELYVSSLMGVKTNVESNLTYSIAPFVDRKLTKLSYNSLSNHGISYKFQQEMIRRLDSELASVNTEYNYTFTEGEPFLNKFKYFLKAVIPDKIYLKKADKLNKRRGNSNFLEMLKKFPILKESVNDLRSYNLKINELMLTSKPDLMPVYLSMAYFVHKMKNDSKI